MTVAQAALSPADFAFIRDRVAQHSGIVLDQDKAYLVEARLTPLVRRQGYTSIEQLTREFRKNPTGQLLALVVDAMTTNETSFFRDAPVYETLREGVFPELIRINAATRRLDIWCAACSSGQEPYSVLMMLREHFPQLANWRIGYVVSDISDEMLERTREGIYSQHEVNRGLPASLLVKYFDRRGLEWQAKPQLREMLDVRKVNLIGTWPKLPPMDIVMIRNVMIYFDQATKKQILQRLRTVLRPSGFLLLGTAETPRMLDDTYERTANNSCYQVGGAKRTT